MEPTLNMEQLDNMFKGLDLPKPQQDNNVTQMPVHTVVPAQTAATQVNAGVLQSAQAKIQMIEAELKNEFVERNTLIHLMQLAIATGTNLLMLGYPGTAKSKITYNMCQRIQDANYFQWMLNKTSDPSEILGSYSIKEMENDKFIRITDGKLPQAHIAFIDEVYKSNAPVLNSLLTIMNERIFYNDGKAVHVPLVSMFGASNEPPEDESLSALHDRFLLRINLGYVQDTNNKKRMFNNYINERAGLSNMAKPTQITLGEIKALQDATKKVSVPKNIINSFIKILTEMERNAIIVSDRRQNECIKIMQGSAVLGGRNSVSLADLEPLVYALWEKEDDIPVIESIITKVINPFDEKFNEYKNQFMKIKASIDECVDGKEKDNMVFKKNTDVQKLVSRVNLLRNQAAKEGHEVQRYIDFATEMTDYMNALMNSALGTDELY